MNKYAVVFESECAEDVEILLTKVSDMAQAFLNLFPDEGENIEFIQEKKSLLADLKDLYADFGWMVDIKQVG